MKEQYWIRPDIADYGNVWADIQTTLKSLTDAECAAEYWRARAAMCSTTPVFTSRAELQKFIQVWERFSTHPHAREGDYE